MRTSLWVGMIGLLLSGCRRFSRLVPVRCRRIWRAEQPCLTRDFGAQILFGHICVGVTRCAHVDLLRRVESPDLPVVREGFPRFFQVPRIAVLDLGDDLGNRGAGSGTRLRLALSASGHVRFAVSPCPHRLSEEVLEAQRLSSFLALDRLCELLQNPELHTFQELRYARLANAEIRGDLMLRPSEIGEFQGTEFARTNAGARFVAALTAAAASTWCVGHDRLLFVRTA